MFGVSARGPRTFAQPYQAPGEQDVPMSNDVMLPPQTPPVGAMFGGGKPKMNWGQFLADFLTNYSAAQGSPLGLAGLQLRRDQQNRIAEAQQHQADRLQGMQDQQSMYGWKRDYDIAHPQPINNDTVNDYQFILEKYGKEAADKYLYNTKVDPIRYLPTGNGGFMAIGGGGPPGGAPSGGEVTATNPQTGQKVRLNPQTNQWEPIGGANPSSGSPTFP